MFFSFVDNYHFEKNRNEIENNYQKLETSYNKILDKINSASNLRNLRRVHHTLKSFIENAAKFIVEIEDVSIAKSKYTNKIRYDAEYLCDLYSDRQKDFKDIARKLK